MSRFYLAIKFIGLIRISVHDFMRNFVGFILLLCLSVSSDAQKGIELGVWLGATHYYGDLQTELAVTDPGIAGGINFRYNFDQRIAFKSSLNFGRISASDEDSQNTFERQRNLSFFSNIVDLSNQIEFNFLPYVHGSKEEFFTPYLFAGLSVFAGSPKTELNGQTYDLRLFGTEGQPIGEEYGRFAFAPMLGMGIKWDINVDWSFNVEFSFHSSQSDYIDDVSGVYPDLALLQATRGQLAVDLSDRSIGGGIGEPGRQRGNSRNNDTYVFFGLSIMRYFGTLPCPRVVRKRHK